MALLWQSVLGEGPPVVSTTATVDEMSVPQAGLGNKRIGARFAHISESTVDSNMRGVLHQLSSIPCADRRLDCVR
jgi:hypothetical protein